ncbi:MAG TPA: hypothetical protein PKZ36_01250 [Candidatus Paceibacterota bacterium]|nr:hypothetical protein [Candidatus Paceibacterota bacterium]HPT18016.1 hypothetical protein [Candidatus Paceibacterota bacterium]
MKKTNQKIKKIIYKYLILCLVFVFAFSIAENSFAYPTVNITANPDSVVYEGISTVTWSSSETDYCIWSDGTTAKTSGSFVTGPLKFNNNYYSLTCKKGNSCVAYSPDKILYTSKNGTSLGLAKNFCYSKTTDGKETCESAQASYGSDLVENVCYWGNTEASNSVIITTSPKQTSGGSITNTLTGGASGIEDTKATLSGSLNPGGNTSISGYFRYSAVTPQDITPVFCNDIYGSNMRSTKEINLNGADSSTTFTTTISGLEENTTYYYCAVGSGYNEITYGGVRSFTTGLSSSSFSVTTNDALVVNDTSAYLNGYYNTVVSANTYFEYRKKFQAVPNTSNASISKNTSSRFLGYVKNTFNKLLQTDKVLASTSDTKFSDWIRVGDQSHNRSTYGKMSTLVSGLSPSSTYQFRAVIETSSSSSTSQIKYGNLLSFTTASSDTTTPGDVPGGEEYNDPCASIADSVDINCNGTGGDEENGKITGSGIDLTVGTVTPTNVTKNTLTPFYAYVKNQGGTSTGKNFYGFFQISTYDRTPADTGSNNNIKNKNQTTPANSAGTPVSKIEKLLTINKAFATSGNSNPANNATAVSTTVTDGSLINLPAVSISTLGAKKSVKISSSYAFGSSGTYYMRACADKKDNKDIGLIKESYENNNCGSWTKIIVKSGGGGNNNSNDDTGSLSLGQIATPPSDAIVRYHEGIEHVFARQIINNIEMAEAYGYKEGDSLEKFAWNFADLLAKDFGYVAQNRKEIRVSLPDIAAYQLRMEASGLTVYEYFDSKIVNIQTTTMSLRGIYDYEYYFNKR